MLELAAFAEGLVDAVLLVALAMAVSAVPWAVVVLRLGGRPPEDPALARASAVLEAAALGLAVCQGTLLALKLASLASYLGADALPGFLGTLQGRAGIVRLVLALVLAATARVVRQRPNSAGRWAATGAVVMCLLVSGAWLTHGAARLEDRPRLMTLTVMHQGAAALWVGGVLQLLMLWWRGRVDAGARATLADATARFARLAVPGVALLLATGVPLAMTYVGSWEGVVGTGYGSLLVAKVALMAIALALGGSTFLLVRRRRAHGHSDRSRVFVEVEALVLVGLVFTAAALSAQPPAIDTPDEQATIAELAHTFAPKWPALRTPSIETKRAGTADPLAPVGWERTTVAYSWSNFSHNVSGLFLLPMGLLALVTGSRPQSPARHWPLGFLVLAVFIFLRSSASDGTWPYGETPLLANDAEGLQHRIAAVLALMLGIFEWRTRTATNPGRRAYVFPILAAVGGLLLVTHAHSAFDLKESYLVQVTHVVMGVLALVIGASRWLELRLADRRAGAVAGIAMVLVALVLLFYQEANIDLSS